MIFDEWAAKNIVSCNLPKGIRQTADVILVEQDEKTNELLSVYDPKGKLTLEKAEHANQKKKICTREKIELHRYQGSDCACLMQDTIDKMSEMLSEVDREISDIYHFLIEHKRLPANKAVKIFYLWYDVLMRRSEIKKYMAALRTGLEPHTYSYSPRTNLYAKLERLVDIEDITKQGD